MSDAPAPKSEIEITPEMIEAGEAVFVEWFSDNSDVIYENGGSGDFASLAASLWAVWKYKLNSSSEIRNAP